MSRTLVPTPSIAAWLRSSTYHRVYLFDPDWVFFVTTTTPACFGIGASDFIVTVNVNAEGKSTAKISFPSSLSIAPIQMPRACNTDRYSLGGCAFKPDVQYVQNIEPTCEEWIWRASYGLRGVFSSSPYCVLFHIMSTLIWGEWSIELTMNFPQPPMDGASAPANKVCWFSF